MIRLVSMSYIALCAVLVFGLYHVKNETLGLEKQGFALERKIDKASSDIELLQAEWATRTAPDVLAQLVKQHLAELRPTNPSQLGTIGSTPRRLPSDDDSIERLLSQYEQPAAPAGKPTL